MLPCRVLLLALFLPGHPHGTAGNPKLWEEPTLCVSAALHACRAHLSPANSRPNKVNPEQMLEGVEMATLCHQL